MVAKNSELTARLSYRNPRILLTAQLGHQFHHRVMILCFTSYTETTLFNFTVHLTCYVVHSQWTKYISIANQTCILVKLPWNLDKKLQIVWLKTGTLSIALLREKIS